MQRDDSFNDKLDSYIASIQNNDSSISSEMESIEQRKNNEEKDEMTDDTPLNEFKGIDFNIEEMEEEDEEEIEIEKYIDEKEDEEKKENEIEENKENEKEGNEEEGQGNLKNESNDTVDAKDYFEKLKKQEEYDRFMEGDDNEVFDVNDANLDTKGISILDQIGDAANDKPDDYLSDLLDTKEKKSFDELNGKKKFEPGKLNKNTMIIAVASFLLLIVAGLWWATRDSKEKKKETVNQDDYLNIEGYKPDFGDYKARSYTNEDNNENSETPEQKVDRILKEGEKEKYENETETKPEVKQSSSSSSQSPVTYTDDTYAERVKAPLRKSLGESVSYDPIGNFTEGGYYPSPQSGGSASDYIDNISNIRGMLSGNDSSSSKNSSNLRYSDGGAFNPYDKGGQVELIPENSIYPGTVIPALLISGINTDYPGMITARVMNNVYDSKTGTKLLIPQGSILRASYSSSSIGIDRIQIAWQTLIINRDGVDFTVNLGSQVGIDSKGYSGIKGTINDHYFAYLKAAGLSCLFTYINSNIFTVSNAQKNRAVQQMIGSAQEVENDLTDKLLDRALDIQPTVKVKNGQKVYVDVNSVLTLVPFEKDKPTGKYIRK